MNFDHAWTFAGQPRDETQRRRPENEPRYCRACLRAAHCSAKASASSAPCLRSSAPDAASISRLANMSLARAFHASPPSQNGTAAACHTRLHRTKHALEICIGQRLSHGARRLACGGRIGPPHPNRLVSACWGASEIGSDFSNGGLRPQAVELPLPGRAHRGLFQIAALDLAIRRLSRSRIPASSHSTTKER